MYRLISVLMFVCILAISSFSVLEDSYADENASEKTRIPGWFRVDTDALGTHFLIGATHSLGSVALESNIFIDDTLGEFDLGVSIPAVRGDNFSLALLPMLGLGFDYKAPDGPSAIFPHLFVFLLAGKFFFKSWTIGTLYSVFDEKRDNEVYTRNYLTYSLNRTVAVGPQFETVVGLGDERTVFSMIFGARINIGYGENNTLGILAGYDTKKTEEQSGLTGRLSFTRRW
ncbi:MAG: hypothetical protein OXT74_18520 [Candidatus Poribacteria bacterium]|nr:hypothetical protein [Candidatus Poribacteria bacterium]